MTDDGAAGWDGWIGPRVWVPALIIVGAALTALGIFAFTRGGDDGLASFEGGSLRQPTHQHADLALIIRGEKFDFNQPQFLSAGEEDEEISPNVHIHAPRVNVVHVHTTHTTWDEFFKSLGFELSDTSLTMPDGVEYASGGEETLKFVVNGVPVDEIQFQEITDLDRVLISFGPESIDEVLARQWQFVTDEACIASETCRERIDPAEPTEACTGRGECS